MSYQEDGRPVTNPQQQLDQGFVLIHMDERELITLSLHQCHNHGFTHHHLLLQIGGSQLAITRNTIEEIMATFPVDLSKFRAFTVQELEEDFSDPENELDVQSIINSVDQFFKEGNK